MTLRGLMMCGASLGALVPAGAALARDAVLLDEITVTATKQEERAVDSLAGVSVIPRSELLIRQPQRIVDTTKRWFSFLSNRRRQSGR